MNVYLFDIDGTLLSSGGAGKAALIEGLADEFGIRGSMEQLALSGRTDRAILADLFRLAGLDDTPHHRQRVLSRYLHHLPLCLARGQGRVLPGVVELLDQLGRRRAAVGLLTGNTRAGAHIKLGHFGLAERFLFGGYGDDHADRNDVARLALAEGERHLGRRVEPAQVWVIGDTPHDVTCARAIGARVAAVTTGYHSRDELLACGPDVLLTDLREAEALLT